ncbi:MULTISPECIES: 50S ribosomal protein L23 [Bacteroidota]|jgi:large subunit ribosomal protein L23|uniref:Large ribosomal subunit protein uL23 n=2 Tax=Flectobacillus TaxID=101 RepID=A0ABT6Z2C3_9BACT|nr:MULTISPECIES: 50S ribosomal protein L23 [Bacteroidota]NBA76071.1 50S ribosomal protein L23 [Emticicia sp. ODNR4P]MDI9861308.1 50S ribosomal protein L23 [Flectobacillus roseus]MDI9871475.1 50S ribosomal protein L23 [Flectobacillus roseus]MDI9875285.1 50S ribosomal protein L23 [Flectobacillus rivi]NBB27384.1 50S ribosomal protein L23 [Cellulophaga sp. BC115SP]
MSIIKRPILTEKTQELQKGGQYVFEVAVKSNKIEIAKEIKKMYGVDVESVNTLRQFGKKKSRSTKSKITTGYTSTFKKAVITVAKGEVIDFYEGI